MRRYFWLVVMLFLIPAVIFAQAELTGRVVGTVVDEGGEAIEGAAVTIVSQDLGIERETVTNARGSYLFAALPPGNYTLTISAPGQRPQVMNFRLSVGEKKPIDVTLEPGEEITEEVTVTAAASALETTETGETLDYRETVEQLPVIDRTLESVAAFAPNFQTGPTPGTVAFGGAPSFDTLVLLDGSEISDPFFGSAPVLYMEDALEEIQVITSGVTDVRYGRFQGGVINAITKSGSNNYEATFRSEFQKESWDSQTPFGEDQSNDLEETYQLTAGGYLLKDRLFWFGGAREVPASAEAETTNQTGETFNTTRDQERFQIKLRGAPTANHIVDVSFLDFEATATNRAGLPPGDLGATNGQRLDPREITSLNYQGVLTPSFFLDVQATSKEVSIASGGDPAGLDPIFTLAPFAFWANHWWDVTDPSVRDNDNASGNLTYALNTEKAGSHVFEAGVQFVESTTAGDNRQSATGLNAILVSGGEPSFAGFGPNGEPLFNLLPPPGTFSFRWDALAFGGEAVIEDLAFYAQDTITIDKWRIDVGLRLDDYESSSPLEFQNFSFTELAPRIGVTYNLTDTWQLQGSYGRYVSRFNDNPFGDATSIGGAPRIVTLYLGPALMGVPASVISDALNNDAYWPITTDLVSPDQPTTFMGSDVNSPFADDLTLSVRKALPRNRGSIVVSYQNREFDDLLDDVVGGVCSDFGLSFTNPLGGCDVTTAEIPDPTDFDTRVWTNLDAAQRDYEAVTAIFEYRPGRKLNLFGSFTFSETQGNYEGEGRNQPASGSILGDWVRSRPETNAAPFGFLDEDVTTRLRAGGTYGMDFDRWGQLVFGGAFNFQSGERWSQTASVDFADDPAYINEAGQSYTHYFSNRGAFRFNDWWRLDGSVRWQVPLFRPQKRGLDLWIKVTALNLTDEDEVIEFDTDSATAQEVNGILTWVPDGNCGPADAPSLDCSGFGEIRNEEDFQLPRTWLLTVGLSFP